MKNRILEVFEPYDFRMHIQREFFVATVQTPPLIIQTRTARRWIDSITFFGSELPGVQHGDVRQPEVRHLRIPCLDARSRVEPRHGVRYTHPSLHGHTPDSSRWNVP